MKILQTNARLNSRCNIPESAVIAVICLVLVLSPMMADAAVVTTDPVLAAALETQRTSFNKAYEIRKKMCEKTLMAQAAVTTALETVHAVESKALEYMMNASAVVSNLVQIKNIAEYAVSIPVDMKNLLAEIPDNPKGAAITAVASKKFIETSNDVVALAAMVKNVVNTTYSFSDQDDNSGRKHVNLLSSAERYSILMDVESRLKQIKRDIMLLRYYVHTLSWSDLWRGLDRKSYVKMISARWEVKSIMRKWDKLSK